jgi:molybdenum cofactor cytidylyltransferase
MAEKAARHLKSAVPDSIAIVRYGDKQLAEIFRDCGLRVVENTQAKQGMSTSIVCGVRASATAQAWLIALADMPFIKSDIIASVAGAVGRLHPIVLPVYNDSHGHPVAFAKQFEAELLQLQGDQGAKPVLNNHPQLIQTIDVDEPMILRDIDVRSDLEEAVTHSGLAGGVE